MIFLISGCCSNVPSDSVIQTAIAKTQKAEATNTPSFTPTQLFTWTSVIPTIPIITATFNPTATQQPEYFQGDAVYQNGYELTVTKVQDPFTPNFYFVQSGNNQRLILIEVIISNISGVPLKLSGLDTSSKVFDTEGYSYTSIFAAPYDISPFYVSLEPGEKIDQVLYFELPKTSILSKINIPINSSEQGGNISASLEPAPKGHIFIPAQLSNYSIPTSSDLGYSMTFLEYSDSAQPLNPGENKPGNKLIAVQISLENDSGVDSLDADSMNAYLVDKNGFVYSASHGISGELGSGSLGIGEKTKGWIMFSIPKESIPFAVKYLTQMFSDNYLYTEISQ